LTASNPAIDEALSLIREAIALSRAEETRVVVSSSRRAGVRWAGDAVTSTRDVLDRAVTVVASFGARRASLSAGLEAREELGRVVREVEELARSAPEDPEYVPEAGAAQVPEIPAWFGDTAAADPKYRAAAAAAAIAAAREARCVSSGWCGTEESLLAAGTSRGFLGAHRQTRAVFAAGARTADGSGSGWAGRDENRLGAIHAGEIARAAATTARQTSRPVGVEGGIYAVVLEPDAVAALIPFLLFSLDARLVAEGRSFFSRGDGEDRLGEKLFDEKITVLSDPADPMLLSEPFSPEGVRREKRIWIQSGTLRDLSFSRYWATRRGGRPGGGLSTALLLGGAATVAELVASTERGLLISRLDYVNMPDPGGMILSGVTRDGTFLIERGKVTRPVAQLRFRDRLPAILSSVEALGVPRRVVGTPVMAVPPMKVRAFTFTGPAGEV